MTRHASREENKHNLTELFSYSPLKRELIQWENSSMYWQGKNDMFVPISLLFVYLSYFK